MSVSGLTISKLARAADVNVETIRYYQRVGLIEQPAKPLQGYRQYPHSMVSRIKFIKRAQRLGFALKEIDELLQLENGHSNEAKELAEQKLSVINEHIADLSAMSLTLDKLINNNDQSQPDNSNRCAIIEALTDENKLNKLAEMQSYSKNKISNA